MKREFSHLTFTSIPCAPTRPRPKPTQAAKPIKSLDMASACAHTSPWFTHTNLFLDYDDANIALGVTQHGVLFLIRGCANRHAACMDGIATVEHSANGVAYGGSAHAAVVGERRGKALERCIHCASEHEACKSERLAIEKG